MARVTVEDCVQVVPNRYELVLLSAQRARDIASGSHITVTPDNDKNPVIALREIAEQTISLDDIRKHIVHGVNRTGDASQEDELLLAIAGEGIEGTPESPTEVAIEEVLFDEPQVESEAEDTAADEGHAADVSEVEGDLDPTAVAEADIAAVEDDFSGDDLDVGGLADEDVSDENGKNV